MLKTVIAILALAVATICLPSPAAYIKADGRPLNIAHRGLCSIFPENTLQAFEAALYQGADFVELDVVYTKQKIALVMHDPFLSRLTNVASFPEFATRRQTRTYVGVKVTDWWVDTFSLAQLRKLGIKQAQAEGRITIFDYKFTFPTLDQVVKMVIDFNRRHNGTRNPDGRPGGILIEAKDSQLYRDLYDMEIGETILQVLRDNSIDTIDAASRKCPIYLHSFDYQTVKYWASHSDLPRNYLIEQGEDFDLADINKYATGIGFEDAVLWDYAKGKPSTIFGQARNLGLQLHIWTFKDDELLFDASSNLQMYEIAQRVLKLDGVITEFSDVYAPIAQILRARTSKQDKKNVKPLVVQIVPGRNLRE